MCTRTPAERAVGEAPQALPASAALAAATVATVDGAIVQ